MHARCAGAHVIVYMCVAWVRVRMFVCAGVFARVRAHAYVFMRGCVCACVVGPTCARVHAYLRARTRMRRVHVHARSRAGARLLSQRNNTADRRGPPVDFIHIYPFLSSPSTLPLLFHGIIISLYNMNTHE